MTCLADGLQTLVTRDSKLHTLKILSSQTIAQISISLTTYQQTEGKHTSTQTKIKENSRKTNQGFHHIKQQQRNSFNLLTLFLTDPKQWFC